MACRSSLSRWPRPTGESLNWRLAAATSWSLAARTRCAAASAVAERDWRDQVIDAANAAGMKASRDDPDSILMADARNNLVPGDLADKLAAALAADLEAKAPEPITRAT